MVLAGIVRPGVVVVAGSVAGAHDLPWAGELLVIDIEPRVDHGDRHVLTLRECVGGFYVGAGADGLTIDDHGLEVPLLREDGTPTEPADELGMAVFDVLTL